MPDVVQSKDVDGPMDIKQMSQLVRDLCRQHEMDRVAWSNLVEANVDHAHRIDQLSDEMLQSNDQFSILMDGHLLNQKNAERQFQDHVQASIRDVTAAIQYTETSLRGHVDAGLANSKTLLAELKTKFETMDRTIAALSSGMAAGHPYAQTSAPPQEHVTSLAVVSGLTSVNACTDPRVMPRTPLIDPQTGYASAPATANPQPGGPAQAFGSQHVPTGQPQQFCMATPVRQQVQTEVQAHGHYNMPPFPNPGAYGPYGVAGGQAGLSSDLAQLPSFPTPGMAAPQTSNSGTATQGSMAFGMPTYLPPGMPTQSTWPPTMPVQSPGHPHAGASSVAAEQGMFQNAPRPHGPAGWPPTTGPPARQLTCDSKIFETKYGQDPRNQYDGGKTGASWHALTRAYLMSKAPILKHLLRWAEDFKKEKVTLDHVAALWPYVDEDPRVMNHLLWAFFNINLTGAAREIFCNVEDFNGLEVWRRVMLKINAKGERRRDELFETIQHPKGTSKFEEVAGMMEEWDTNQRLFIEAGGDPLRKAEKQRILRKIIPELLANQLSLLDWEDKDWTTQKDWVLEKARTLAVQQDARGTKPLHMAEPDTIDLNALAELELNDAVASLGDRATPDVILALVNRRTEKYKGAWKGKGGGKGGKGGDNNAYKPPTTKEGTVLCANCGETGHSKVDCKQPPIDKSKRVCFACKKPGHTSANCPTKADVRALEQEDDGEVILGAIISNPFYFDTTSFQAGTYEQDSDDSSDAGQTSEDDNSIGLSSDNAYNDSPGLSSDRATKGDHDVPTSTNVCCRFQCEDRGVRCKQQVLAEYLEYVQSRSATDDKKEESEPTIGFHAESETSESSIPVIQEEGDADAAHTSTISVFSFPSPSKGQTPEPPQKDQPAVAIPGVSSVTAVEKATKAEAPCDDDCNCNSNITKRRYIKNKSTRRNLRRREAKKQLSIQQVVKVAMPVGEIDEFELIDDVELIEDTFEIINDKDGQGDDCPNKLEESSDEESFDQNVCGEAEDTESDDDTWLAPEPSLSRLESFVDQLGRVPQGLTSVNAQRETISGYQETSYKSEWEQILEELDDTDDSESSNSKRVKDPRPNQMTDEYFELIEEFEIVNFLDSEDIELNAAALGATEEDEFLDVYVEAAADSGAGEHVLGEEDAPTYTVEDSPGSKAGQNFIGAGGHRMANRGQVKLSMRAENGKKGRDVKTTFQVAKVTRPLMSVSKICDAGMTMKFTAAMAIVEDKAGKEVMRFKRQGGLYVSRLRLRNPKYKPKNEPFARQGSS